MYWFSWIPGVYGLSNIGWKLIDLGVVRISNQSVENFVKKQLWSQNPQQDHIYSLFLINFYPDVIPLLTTKYPH